MDAKLDVDEIWKSLGIWGRYQKFQLFILFMDAMAAAFHLLSTVVIGYRYPYQCKELSYNCSDSDGTCNDNITYLEYGKCSITTYNNYTNLTTTESCLNGYDYHVSSDRTFVTEWDLVCDRSELGEFTQTLVIIGQATGAAVTTQFADRFGRKPVHVVSHIAVFVIALAMAFAPNLTAFSILRYLVGTFQQGIVMTNTVLGLEILPRKSRFTANVIDGFGWTTGIALLALLGYLFRDLSWRDLQMTLALYSVYSLGSYWVLEESLRWLLANGKIKEAERIIRKAARWNKVQFDDVIKHARIHQECKETSRNNILSVSTLSIQVDAGSLKIQNGISSDRISAGDAASGNSEQMIDNSNAKKKANVKRYTFLTILKTRKVLVNSFILWYIWIVDSLTYYGIALISYTLSGNRFLNFFLTAIMEYPATVTTYFLANRLGRKRLVIFFHVITGVACLIATALLTLADGNTRMLTASTAFTLIGKYGSSGSFSSLFLYTPEVYPTNLRNVGLGVSSSISRIGGMLAPFAGPLADRIKWAPGTIFGILCILVVVVCLKLPETTTHRLPQTLEDMDKWKEQRKTDDIEYSIST